MTTTLPFVRGSDTSKAAAVSMEDHAPTMRERVRDFIKDEGPVTCDEVERYLGLSHQSASARIRELSRDGVIIDTGNRKKTRSGRTARLYSMMF